MLNDCLEPGPRLRRLVRWWRDFGRDTSAGTTILLSLSMPLLAGALGVGVDVGSWYMEKRKLQHMADAAALAGARVKAADQSDATVVGVATNDAKRNGFVASATMTLAINTPPTSGPYAAHDGAVEAVVTMQLKTLFAAALMGGEARTLTARSVVAVKVMADPEIRKSVCLLSLITSGEKAIFSNGSGGIVAKDCSMAAHSTHARSLYLNGSGSVKGYTALLKGGYYANGSGSFIFSAPAATYLSDVIADPYAELANPVVSGACLKTNYVASAGAILEPGRYCGGILNSGSGPLYLNPGTYYIDGGDVTNSGSGSIQCNGCTGDLGVTLVFTSSGSTSLIGGLYSSGAGRIVLSAPGPTSGETYIGMVVYQDRRASAVEAEFGFYLNGSGLDQFSGVVYVPSRTAHLNSSGTVSETGKACAAITALKINLNGSGTMQTADCGLMGAQVPQPKQVGLLLVE